MRSILLPVCLLSASLAGAAPRPGTVAAPGTLAKSTCIDCHSQLDDAALNAPARAAADDIHYQQGVTCAGCHGGDPTASDPEAAMDPRKGFVGSFTPQAIPPMCGSCHADSTFMLRFAPNIPTDQLSQYRTSKHGLALAKGDRNVATCISCHGAHGVRAPKDARSPVFPTHVVETCGACHANAALMKPYGISGHEVADYERSVHYAALTRRSDLSAPTCPSCHGAHGATPPGVESVASVCGTCHVTQEQLFDGSPHKAAFAALGQASCEACHSNHAILNPSDAWIGVGKGQVCGDCHESDDAGGKAAQAIAAAINGATGAEATARTRVDRVEKAGMLMEDAEVKLEGAHQAIVLARNAIHTVSGATITEHTKAAVDDSSAADTLAQKAEDELRFRRRGLFISLGIILVAIVALVMKIRQMGA